MEGAEIPKGMSTIDAVADSVMIAYARQLKNRNYEFYDHGPGNDLEYLLHEATDGGCADASVDALFFLTAKYQEAFDKAFILTNWDFDELTTIRTKKQYFHTYAVVHGSDNYWYAVSPSNHDSKKPKAYALEMIREKSLKKILSRIQKRDQGQWPGPGDIEKMLMSPEYENPSVDMGEAKLRAFEIVKQDNKTSGMMDENETNLNL